MSFFRSYKKKIFYYLLFLPKKPRISLLLKDKQDKSLTHALFFFQKKGSCVVAKLGKHDSAILELDPVLIFKNVKNILH